MLSHKPCWYGNSSEYSSNPCPYCNEHKQLRKVPERDVIEICCDPIRPNSRGSRGAFLAGIMCGVPINAWPRGAERQRIRRWMQCVGESEDGRSERTPNFHRTKPHFVISCDIGFVPSELRIGLEGERGAHDELLPRLYRRRSRPLTFEPRHHS